MGFVYKLKKKLSNYKETFRRSKYAHYYRNGHINNNVILYDSYFGRGILCGPYALFKQLLNDPDFRNMTHVWSIENLQDNENIINEYKNYPNIKFVKRHGKEYLRHLATAGYIITNVSFPYYYCKREGQIYINTWHGVPLKYLGYDIPDAEASITNVLRNMLSADYLISPCPFLTDIYLKKYKLDGLYPGKIIQEGYPRNDIIFNTDKSVIINKLASYGIKVDPDKEIILYAPTWRGRDYDNPETNMENYFKLKEHLEKRIDTNKYQILLKPHQVVYKAIAKRKEYNGLFIPAYVDANEILSITDILISDYSSIFFDFLVTGKPVLFYIPDLKEYQDYRGLYFTPERLPGPRSESIEDLVVWINNIDSIIEHYSPIWNEARQLACPWDDGKAAERIVDIVFKGSSMDVYGKEYNILSDFNVSPKKKILFYGGGFRTNGITTSLANLLNNIDYNKYDVTVLGANLKNGDGSRLIFNLNKHARVMARISNTPATFSEHLCRYFSAVFGILPGIGAKIFPKRMFDREFKRCFGNADFDTVVDYSGYGSFYTMLLLSSHDSKKLIWQHNDLCVDKKKRIGLQRPHSRELRAIFSCYRFYDKIVGCSKDTMEINLKKIGYKDLADKCCYVKNQADFNRVIEGAKESYTPEECNSLGFTDLLSDDTISFVTIGRLSCEKNHENLIRAFGRLYKENPNVRLYIIGSGPLWEHLALLVTQLGLERKVILTGTMDNPFKLMKECDCFILPSLYEGQPITLLEARLLGLPIIMSDFGSASSSLFDNGQLVIHSDVDSIYAGLKEFLNGNVPTAPFDYKKYNADAMRQLEAIL